MSELAGAHIHITGVVQGVGFRPFVYNLANQLALTGWVRNTSAGVDIQVDGLPALLTSFIQELKTKAPPLARIDCLDTAVTPYNGFTTFEIIQSQRVAGAFIPLSPDMSVCLDCFAELFDPDDRRYRYPFINCTHCGPRFTIIRDIPYDRPNTTMAFFAMCKDCKEEYHNPQDRRFHAQPIACPVCGPQVWLEFPNDSNRTSDKPSSESAIQTTRQLLREGKIIAIKGLGGFHLACDATNSTAVSELRRRKKRVEKPFAVMMWDSKAVSRACDLDHNEQQLLESLERPILILNRLKDSAVVPEAAPGQGTVGVMLPYSPLHYLLLEPEAGYPQSLVMTSGNISEEPIAFTNEDARNRLLSLADAFLFHNRDIHMRCDDSVIRVFRENILSHDTNERMPLTNIQYPLRRSRGYAPFPFKLPWSVPQILATGSELKNSFCLTQEHYAFLSHHIGNMENYETLNSFEESIAHYESIFRVHPQAIAYDLHPDYLATRYAQARAMEEGLPAFGVQHHYAHIIACLAENKHPDGRPVIGVSFDGTGYGDDGAIWGGEFLLADYSGYQRVGHLAYVPLPGGDKAIRHPWRTALAYLHHAGILWDFDLPPMKNLRKEDLQLQVIQEQLKSGLNAPLASSMGRLFDAVAALAGVRQNVNYEAQAAVEFEAMVELEVTKAYHFDFREEIIDPDPLITTVVADLRAGKRKGQIAAYFHNGVAQMVLEKCCQLKAQYGISEVALSGGVWQNITLLRLTLDLLRKDDFDVYIHRQVPTNDGGLSLGQAVAAAFQLKRD